jgi:hypothetical protein
MNSPDRAICSRRRKQHVLLFTNSGRLPVTYCTAPALFLQAQKWHFRGIFAFSGIIFSWISYFFTFSGGFGRF